MAVLKLPTDPRTAVFRLLVKKLKANPILAREIKTWLVWDGDGRSALGLPADNKNASIRLTPLPGPQSWYTPDSNIGPLQVRVEFRVLSDDADDFINLHGAIERALYPVDRDTELALEAEFRAAGAVTGQWQFTQPPIDPQLGAERDQDGPPEFYCVGLMQIDVERIIRS